MERDAFSDVVVAPAVGRARRYLGAIARDTDGLGHGRCVAEIRANKRVQRELAGRLGPLTVEFDTVAAGDGLPATRRAHRHDGAVAIHRDQVRVAKIQAADAW